MGAPRVDLGIPGLGPAERVGAGGFGTVYRAEQPTFRRAVAVKVLSGSLDDGAQRRFERECQAMGSLSDHPGIVTVFDAGTTAGGAPYLLMAYHPVGSLADRLVREGPLGWETAVRVGVEVASALAAAHRLDVLHRDVKPANILLSSYGTTQLADFGIARIIGATQTRGAEVTASILHAAPEVLEGKPYAATGDIYSAGATLHEIVTGRPVFLGDPDEPLAALVSRISTARPPDLRDHGVPDDVAQIMADSMAKAVADRPATAAELARRLAQAGRRHDVDLGVVAASETGLRSPRPAPTAGRSPRGYPPPTGPVAAPPDPASAPTVAVAPTETGPFATSHVVPGHGLPAWARPDPTGLAVATLDPWLPVQVLRWWGEWAHIRCANGWEAWVNGSLLVPT